MGAGRLPLPAGRALTCARSVPPAPALSAPLCPPSVPRFIKYTGYGNAAGLLAARGLMAGGRPEGQYSEDEDTDTDEYKAARARCVPRSLGRPSPARATGGRVRRG